MPDIYRQIVRQETYKFITKTYFLSGFFSLLTRLMMRIFHKRILLIFGMSRSGTSMLPILLSLNISSIYLHEPDSDLLKYHYGSERHYTPEKFWKFVKSESQKKFRAHLMVCLALLTTLHSGKAVRTIFIKPIALLEDMPEISAALPEARILYICRHPAGRTESILRQLEHDQNITEISNDQLEELGRDWGRTNQKVLNWFKHHPNWHWVAFERLTNDPLGEFEKLYREFGLTWNEWVSEKIQQKTAGQNGDFYETQRDASQQADKWRKSLTEEQADAIRRGTLPFETNLYEGF